MCTCLVISLFGPSEAWADGVPFLIILPVFAAILIYVEQDQP